MNGAETDNAHRWPAVDACYQPVAKYNTYTHESSIAASSDEHAAMRWHYIRLRQAENNLFMSVHRIASWFNDIKFAIKRGCDCTTGFFMVG